MKTFSCRAWAAFAVSGCLLAGPGPGQVELDRAPRPQPHHQAEYTLDAPADPLAWSRQPAGLQVAFGSTDERYLRCEPPRLESPARAWKGSGWRGERLSAQILVWSSEPREQVRLEAGELKDGRGRVIDRSQLTLRLVRYVLSDLAYGARDFTCEVKADSAYLMPDRLETFERFELPARTVRPVWLTLEIPRTAEPGIYNGAVQVVSSGARTSLSLEVQVQPLVLPPPREWSFRLDLWQNPWVLASYYQVVPWSEEHKTLLRQHLRLYADAGGKYITTYTVHSPWSDNSFVLEGTMIDWSKTATGSWRFDYRIFDEYVELAMQAGVDGAITLYTPVPWGHRFRYRDEASGDSIFEEWPPASEPFRKFWKVFLDDLREHLLKKGWLKKTYLGINENPLEHTVAAATFIKQHSRDWKITYAGDWHPELSPLLDDYSVLFDREPGVRELQERAARGFTTTFYVCCNPPRPNNFVFSPPVEGRYLGWYAAAQGYDGFLRWAYDAWPADPTRDARHTLWPAGDCFLVYPGAASSIRFEKLREGIVDYEKIRILRARAATAPEGNARKLLAALELHLRNAIGRGEQGLPPLDAGKLVGALETGREILGALTGELSPGTAAAAGNDR